MLFKPKLKIIAGWPMLSLQPFCEGVSTLLGKSKKEQPLMHWSAVFALLIQQFTDPGQAFLLGLRPRSPPCSKTDSKNNWTNKDLQNCLFSLQWVCSTSGRNLRYIQEVLKDIGSTTVYSQHVSICLRFHPLLPTISSQTPVQTFDKGWYCYSICD